MFMYTCIYTIFLIEPFSEFSCKVFTFTFCSIVVSSYRRNLRANSMSFHYGAAGFIILERMYRSWCFRISSIRMNKTISELAFYLKIIFCMAEKIKTQKLEIKGSCA